MSSFVGKDLSVIMYLEEPDQTANRTRTSVNATVTPGSSHTISFSSDGYQGCYAIISTFNIDNDGYLPNAVGKITMTYKGFNGSSEVCSKIKEVPLSAIVGFSMTELMDYVGSGSWSLFSNSTLKIENNTSEVIKIRYAMACPLLILDNANGLIGFDHGERLGSDEKYPDFGVCNAYGSVNIRDDRQRIARLMDDPTAYGLDEFLSSADLRVEAFVGETLLCVMEMEDADYSDSGRSISVTLKSPFLRMTNYQSRGKLVVDKNITMAEHVYRFLYFSYNTIGVPLGSFDFSYIHNSSSMFMGNSSNVGIGVLEGAVSVSSFIDYACQATANSFVFMSSLATSMKYKAYSVSWFPNVTPSVMQYSSSVMTSINPTDVLDDPVFDVVRKNVINKVTYRPYQVTVSESTEEHDTDFDVLKLRTYTDMDADKNAFVDHWLRESGLTSLPSGEVFYGCRYPRPEDLEYDGQTGKYGVHMDKMENRQKRSLTRCFLWRLPFAEDSDMPNSLSKFSSSFKTMLNLAVSRSHYKPLNTDNTGYLFSAGGADMAGTAVTFDYEGRYSSMHVQDMWETHTVHNTGVLKRTTFTSALLNDITSYMSFYANLVPGKFIDGDSAIYLGVKACYWYTSVFAGSISLSYLSGNNPDYASSMRTVSEYVEKTWSQSRAEKMSQYINLEYTSEQAFCYESHIIGDIRREVNFMLWAPFGDWTYGRYGQEDYVSHTKAPAFSYGGVERVGTPSICDGDNYVYTYDHRGRLGSDYSDGYGEGINSDADDGQRIGWGCGWFHTGDDSGACGGFITTMAMAFRGYASNLVTYDPSNGNALISVPLPTNTEMKNIIMNGSDNFLGQSTESGVDHPGRWRVGEANAFCTLWSPAMGYSLIDEGEDGVVNLDDANKSPITWSTGRPLYGFAIKGFRATVKATYYDVVTLEEQTVQFNRGEKYNYDLATNPLMNQTTTVSNVNCVDWLVGMLGDAFAYGRRVMSLKTKAVYSSVMVSSPNGVWYRRPPRLGDTISGSNVKVMRDGAVASIVPSADEWFLRGFEIVYESGKLYYNLELMENWDL